MEDISDLYTVPSFEPVPERESLVAKDVMPDFLERPSVDISVSQTVIKRRGLGRKPAMVLYRLRIDQILLDRVRSLGGNASEHIRKAVYAYCDAFDVSKGGGK